MEEKRDIQEAAFSAKSPKVLSPGPERSKKEIQGAFQRNFNHQAFWGWSILGIILFCLVIVMLLGLQGEFLSRKESDAIVLSQGQTIAHTKLRLLEGEPISQKISPEISFDSIYVTLSKEGVFSENAQMCLELWDAEEENLLAQKTLLLTKVKSDQKTRFELSQNFPRGTYVVKLTAEHTESGAGKLLLPCVRTANTVAKLMRGDNQLSSTWVPRVYQEIGGKGYGWLIAAILLIIIGVSWIVVMILPKKEDSGLSRGWAFWVMIVFFLFAGGAWMGCAKEQEPHLIFTQEPKSSDNSPLQVYGPLSKGMTIQQRISANDAIEGVQLQFATYEKENDHGTLIVSLIDLDTKEVLTSTELSVNQLEDNSKILVNFPQRIPAQYNEFYLLSIQAAADVDETCLVGLYFTGDAEILRHDPIVMATTGSLYVRTYYGIFDSIRVLCQWGGILLAVVSMVLVLVTLYTYLRLESIYLVISLTVGILLLFVQTPVYGFDIDFQKDSSYILSNLLMGKTGYFKNDIEASDFNEETMGREYYFQRAGDDISDLPHYASQDVVAAYYKMAQELFFGMDSDQKEEVAQQTSSFSTLPVTFFPQALGFTAARLLGLNRMWLLLLGRLCNYLLFVAFTYYSIKVVPFGKHIFFLIGLMPVSLMQSASLSRDSIVLGLAFFVCAKTLQIAYTERRITWWQLAQLITAAALLAPSKVVYLPVCLFPAIIPFKRYGKPKKTKEWRYSILVLLLGFAVTLSAFLACNFSLLADRVVQETAYSVNNQQAGHTLQYIMTHLPDMIYMVVNTFRVSLGDYLMNAVAPLEIKAGLSNGVILGWLLLLVLACIPENKMHKPSPGDRGWMALLATIVFALLTVVAIQWTPLGANSIVGLQGRYLTPILPLILLSIYGLPWIQRQASVNRFLRVGAAVLPCVSVFNMYLWTLFK